jgi:hypothetical protein
MQGDEIKNIDLILNNNDLLARKHQSLPATRPFFLRMQGE